MAAGSAVLLVLSFPSFEFWWLAWIGLVPLLFAVATTSRKRKAFILGLIWGVIFFYGTCWWLTYPMIHHAGMAPWLAYPLLLLPVIFGSLFPAVTCVCIARLVNRFGNYALLATPLVWITFDWLRQVVTGLDWNALGYSQAFRPALIQSAQLGGIYAITSLVVVINATLALLILKRDKSSFLTTILVATVVIMIIFVSRPRLHFDRPVSGFNPRVVSVQPNVPMTELKDSDYRALLDRHVRLSSQAFSLTPANAYHRLLIWPESPMNFSYSRDPQLQNVVANLARTHGTQVLLNSLEPAPNGGSYNSAILVNEQGQKIAQYDKIRLMPFGEYVPLPRWLPGSGSVRSIVGEFTPGSSHTLMPLGAIRVGVFICIEAAHPDVARALTNNGADVLINISNDGYLGPTPVMRQHLANAIFRAVENNRDLVRVTNTGISAYVDANGNVTDPTTGYQEAVRTWTISKSSGTTFYSRFGNLFACGCALITLGLISATFMTRRKGTHASGVLGS